MSRIILWDIETSNLNANFGYCLCAGWKVLGKKKVNVIKISDFDLFETDPTNDTEVVKAMRDVLIDADAWIGHYSTRFDEPYLNTRLLQHKLDPLPPMGSAHIDTWRIARYKLKLNSNRLATLASFFHLEEKTQLSGPHWIKAMAGNKSSLRYIYNHCRQDVVVLEQVYNKIKSLGYGLINVALPDVKENACPRCGVADSLQKRGFHYAAVTKTQRYCCTDCGGWSKGRPQRIKEIEIR